MKAHPLADLFPMIEGAEFDAFAADVRANGLREPIVVLDGMILDGRNRFRAGAALGLFPGDAPPEAGTVEFVRHFRMWMAADGDPLAFVLSLNLARRHLNDSQRAMIAARLANMRHGGDRRGVRAANLPLVSQSAAAERLHVSERTVRAAVKVAATAEPEIKRAVDAGRMAVSAAAQAATLAPERQREIAARADAGDPNAARTIIKKGARAAREASLGLKQCALPERRFGVILADPEWRFEPYSRASGLDRAADNHYPTSPIDVIAARDVAKIAADDCVLFLWATVPMLPQALGVMAAWGFSYRSHIIWAKTRVGTGYWFRNAHELMLVGTRGEIPAPAPGTQWASLIEAETGEHSAKPEVFWQMIERYFPNLPKIELNRRGPARQGWAAWGNEAAAAEEPAGAEK